MIVTFDLFSALTDSRTGGSAVFADLAARRGWDRTGDELYDRWDRHNKGLQRTARPPVTFSELSRQALAQTYDDFGLGQETVDVDLTTVEESVAEWPLWPDVADAVRAVADAHRVGILSNVDDPLARTTRAARLVESELLLTSQRLGAYKPSEEIYRRAAATVAPDRLVHVAASARDVRGALEAGITTVRLVRRGHVVDAEGPQPSLEVEEAADLPGVLQTL
ncbi:HAD-IA family hydrolase [Blastococcus mobilis]|uniref:2-haloacid dehalogenase n=1 Tax=Blastococcus mobilis TaxID=1938746 RepID=A0A238VZK7_9ACTN|nr:HAD-IA family hydrolase [Blastococcus mobilis]SNR39750.1 2-haloacid dehalogenase [Blastococcus mobilis]